MNNKVFNLVFSRNISKNRKKTFLYFNGRHYVFALLMIIVCSSFHTPDDDWKLEKDSDGIKVYTRYVGGSNYKEVKTQLTVRSTLAGVVKVLNDVPSFTQWAYNCKASKLLKSIGSSEYYAYCLYSVPWPADDRDEVTHSVMTQDTLTKVITIKRNGVKAFIPENDGIVRIKSVDATITVTPLSAGDEQITFQVLMDPGGIVPAFLVNMFIANAPYVSFMNFKKIISLPENCNYRSEEIIEP